MEIQLHCERCGGEIIGGGLCAVCLLQRGLPPETIVADGLIGTKIQGYTIIDRLGEGGMGTVYLAEQTEPIVRDVAFKLIKRGLDTDQLLRRFEQERRTLARMEHPGIARIIDAGAAPDGRPYFVMELVDGIPISHYAKREKLDTAAKIQLLLLACEAIQHAHQKGVMHRDLKPSNMLVSKHPEGGPSLKVIDFGLAKATEAYSAGDILHTQMGQVLGTPAYMSPEQSSGFDDVDTRTDVYALGAILYELLVGEPPPTNHASQSARPSRKLGRHAFPIDLDWITLKALAEHPKERYQSVRDLAADLEAFLDKKPVAAAQPLFAYRLRRFSQRYRKRLISAALILTGIALGVWQAWAAHQSRIELNDASKRTTSEAARAQLVSELFFEVFSHAQRDDDPQHEEQMVQLLRQFSRERLGPNEHLDPYTTLSLRHFIGFALMSMRRFDEAESEIRAAERVAKVQLGFEEGHPLIIAARVDLVGLLIETRQYAKAEKLLKPLLDFQLEAGKLSNEDTIHMQRHMGRLHFEGRRWQAAIAQLITASDAAKKLFGLDDPTTIDCQKWLSRAFHGAGRSGEALVTLSQALETARDRFGDDHPITQDLIADRRLLAHP